MGAKWSGWILKSIAYYEAMYSLRNDNFVSRGIHRTNRNVLRLLLYTTKKCKKKKKFKKKTKPRHRHTLYPVSKLRVNETGRRFFLLRIRTSDGLWYKR